LKRPAQTFPPNHPIIAKVFPVRLLHRKKLPPLISLTLSYWKKYRCRVRKNWRISGAITVEPRL